MALPALLTTVSLVLLCGTSVAPVGRMGLVALAGLVPAAAVVSGGLRAGLLCYAAAGILGLILVPEKGSVLLYLLFFGLYPTVKSLAERRCSRLGEYAVKLAFFNLALTVLWFGLRDLFLPFLPDMLNGAGTVYLAGNAIFLLYDYGFSRIIALYTARVDCLFRK